MQCRSQAVAPSKPQDTPEGPAVHPGHAPHAMPEPLAQQVARPADDGMETRSVAQADIAAAPMGTNLPALRIPSPARAASLTSHALSSPCASSPGSSSGAFSPVAGAGSSSGAFSLASMSASGLSPWASELASPPASPASAVAPANEGPPAAPAPQGFLARLWSAARGAWRATHSALARAGQYISRQVADTFSARPRN